MHYSVCQNNNNKIKAVEIQICRRLTEVPIQSHLHNSPKNCPTTKLSKNTPQKTTSNTWQLDEQHQLLFKNCKSKNENYTRNTMNYKQQRH